MAHVLAPKVRGSRAPFALTIVLAALTSAPSFAGDPPKGPPPAPSASASASASAPDQPPPSDAPPSAPGEPIDEATMLFDMGTAAIDEGKFAEAAQMLARVWAKKKTYDVAAALGAAELRLGKFRDAAEHLSFAQRFLPPSELGSTAKAIGDDFAAARREVGELRVTVSVPGAEVRAGDRVIGAAPITDPVFVDPGALTVTAHKEGFVSATGTVLVKKGGTAEVALTLTTRDKLPAFILGGAGVAAVAVGAVLIGVSQAKLGEGQSLRDEILKSGGTCAGASPAADCAALKDAGAVADATGTASIFAFGLGVAAIGAGIAYYFWPAGGSAPPSKATAGTRRPLPKLVPIVAADRAGVVISGSF